MIYKHIIDELKKYSFIDKVEYRTNYYIKIFYRVSGKEESKLISRRASSEQLIRLITKIKKIADKITNPKFETEMPVEIIKYEGD